MSVLRKGGNCGTTPRLPTQPSVKLFTGRHRHPAGIDNCRRARHAWDIQAMTSATGKFRRAIFIPGMKNSA